MTSAALSDSHRPMHRGEQVRLSRIPARRAGIPVIIVIKVGTIFIDLNVAISAILLGTVLVPVNIPFDPVTGAAILAATFLKIVTSTAMTAIIKAESTSAMMQWQSTAIVLIVGLLIGSSGGPVLAGPCSAEIAQLEASLEALPDPTARAIDRRNSAPTTNLRFAGGPEHSG
ncbi:hypothetical protein [Tardiphaga sp.]|uniref:hypothetical protein n=1 Tax=Tardiphaga sp. TaxID=1926292 RepID=UPI00352A49D7